MESHGDEFALHADLSSAMIYVSASALRRLFRGLGNAQNTLRKLHYGQYAGM